MLARTSNCDQERLRKSLDGGLPEATEREMAQHLETCATCRQQMERLAADENWWMETREALSAIAADHDDVWDGFGSQAGQGGVPSVPLDFLAPSANPAMLGRLGEFEILEEIGCGGMGIVLKGYDQELNRYVAVKVLHPFCATSAAGRRRFVREAQAAAAIVHQHVVAIHSVDANHHPPYLVMAFVPGESLQQRLHRHGPLELVDALRIGQQVAEGLAAAHAQGLVHRDIKPGNILLERNVERVLLTDFGLARAADDASLTRSGVIAGTPQYMSPEQARGDQVDHRTDLFSLGTVLYTMLAGHSPFRAESAMGVLRRVCEDTPRPLREVNPHVPQWLEAFIAQLQAKSAADRFENAAQVATLLKQALAHVQQPTLVPLPEELVALNKRPEPPRRKWWFRFAGVLLFVGAVLLVSHFLTPNADRHETTDDNSSRESLPQGLITAESWDDGVQPEVEQIREALRQWEADAEF